MIDIRGNIDRKGVEMGERQKGGSDNHSNMNGVIDLHTDVKGRLL